MRLLHAQNLRTFKPQKFAQNLHIFGRAFKHTSLDSRYLRMANTCLFCKLQHCHMEIFTGDSHLGAKHQSLIGVSVTNCHLRVLCAKFLQKIMTVYVDDSRLLWRGRSWCHLVADSVSELHAFAAQLGLRREWFQYRSMYPHYDVTVSVQRRALALGAQVGDKKTIVACAKRLRVELSSQARHAGASASLSPRYAEGMDSANASSQQSLFGI